MAGFTGFEEIEAWKKARELAKIVYMATSRKEFRPESGLRSQLYIAPDQK